jgi:hypothetical protein
MDNIELFSSRWVFITIEDMKDGKQNLLTYQVAPKKTPVSTSHPALLQISVSLLVLPISCSLLHVCEDLDLLPPEPPHGCEAIVHNGDVALKVPSKTIHAACVECVSSVMLFHVMTLILRHG